MNVASRLESSGVSGRIQVSERVAQLLEQDGRFELECRGPVHVKGKGQLTTYLVVTEFDNIDSNGPELVLPPPTESRPEQAADGGGGSGEPGYADYELSLEPPPALADDDEVEELCSSSQQQQPKSACVQSSSSHAGKQVTNVSGTSVVPSSSSQDNAAPAPDDGS